MWSPRDEEGIARHRTDRSRAEESHDRSFTWEAGAGRVRSEGGLALAATSACSELPKALASFRRSMRRNFEASSGCLGALEETADANGKKGADNSFEASNTRGRAELLEAT